MKIQTQTRLVIACIVAVPLFIICSMVMVRLFYYGPVSSLPDYEDISNMLSEPLSAEEWDSRIQEIAGFKNFYDVTIFRNDYLVLYSELPDFSPGDFATFFNLSMLLTNPEIVIFSIGTEETQVYVITKLYGNKISTILFRNNKLSFFIIGFIGIMVLSIICISIAITRTITNSVKVLENATRRIAEGELDLKLDVKGSNEVISLANSLNKMRAALKEDKLRRSRFIMGITHDLKTPLALIKGYAEAIGDGVADNPASRVDATEIITAKADQLEDMINDLLNYVRMETGELRTQLEDVNLTAFLQNMVKTLNNDVGLLHHSLIHDINLPQKIFVPMDERLMHRAFENLIHNAVRYTPNGAVIRLSAVRLENSAGSAGVELTIRDNGQGIDKEDLPHIFDMFYRGSSSRREQGMGLGLAVVKWVVDYHGWAISVTSEKGKGTCFCIGIPLKMGD
jgi:signal transduction histidine kinase